MDHYLPAVHRALAFIEESLTRPVTLEAIARRAGFSLWHFQRIFQAYTGESLAAYRRRRRLTVATLALRHTRRRILDIALEHQFESHASFTRAFRAAFRAAPGTFRRGAQPLPANATARATGPARSSSMKPEIVRLPAFTFVGLEARFIGPASPEANNHLVIPPLFDRLFARSGELPPTLDACMYGLSRCLPAEERRCDEEMIYLAARSVGSNAQPPAGMVLRKVRSQAYAVFVHRGPVVRIDETLARIYGEWLPQSDYQPVGEGSLERYDPERFRDGGENAEFDILIAVKPRPGRR